MADRFEQAFVDAFAHVAAQSRPGEALDPDEVVPGVIPIGRRRSRVTVARWIGAAAAVAAVSTAVLMLVPGLLVPQPVPAVPVATPTSTGRTAEPTPTTEPTSSATAEDPEAALSELTVSTAGWKTYSSPEYPVTFQYPADWEISHPKVSRKVAKATQLTPAGIVDGCRIDGCTVYASPPGDDDDGRFVVLSTAGFEREVWFAGQYPGVWHLATLPELRVWTSADPSVPPSTAAIMMRSVIGFTVGTTPKDYGPPYDYMLSAADGTQSITLGETNPLKAHPEAAFIFRTGGTAADDQDKTLVTILASARPNPGYQPTQPEGRSGQPR